MSHSQDQISSIAHAGWAHTVLMQPQHPCGDVAARLHSDVTVARSALLPGGLSKTRVGGIIVSAAVLHSLDQTISTPHARWAHTVLIQPQQ